VRPVPRSDAVETVDIGRDHAIVRAEATADRPFPVLSLIGGRWTMFRAFAQLATDHVLAELKTARRLATEHRPIGGGHQFPSDEASRQRWVGEVARKTGLADARVQELLARYGTRADAVAAFCAAAPDVPLPDAPEYSEREMLYLVQCEMAITLEDIIFRRTTLAMWGRLTFALLGRLANIVAQARGLDESQTDDLLTGAVSRLKDENGIDWLSDLEHRRLARNVGAATGSL
jgi:glycerol-3-phosphate dehydrogenase